MGSRQVSTIFVPTRKQWLQQPGYSLNWREIRRSIAWMRWWRGKEKKRRKRCCWRKDQEKSGGGKVVKCCREKGEPKSVIEETSAKLNSKRRVKRRPRYESWWHQRPYIRNIRRTWAGDKGFIRCTCVWVQVLGRGAGHRASWWRRCQRQVMVALPALRTQEVKTRKFSSALFYCQPQKTETLQL